ncbi:MAG TPA: ABC transporter permease subunit [Candidatus Binatia bacterium]|jgi:ABC-type transport system involved in multi-copper enzyme maturation permease subunit|nr:ABC transporter permease subunit [Candidatus Binatia bacterium]
MTFLPIVQRELRAAVRRRSTYRVRWWTALLAMLVSFFALVGVGASGGGSSIGGPLFSILTGYAFGLCLLAGVLLTADSLSEEKREGTLGLLFLTDLHGYDVVLGKFMARALNAFYALFALLPMAALPLLIGGVTGAEFWRMTLALANALFFSLATGVFVSALVRDAQKALGGTLGLLLLLGAGLPALADLGARAGLAPALLDLVGLSPFFPFSGARELIYAAHPGKFWTTLLASHALAWTFLGVASWILPWIWREGAERFNPFPNAGSKWRWWQRRNSVSIRQAMLKARLLSKNPVLWLTSQERGLRWAAWAVVLAWGAMVLFAEPVRPRGAWRFTMGWFDDQPHTAFGFILKVLFAFQACRFFAEGRRNGSLELLLSTPLTNREIIQGQLAAIWRIFRWPVLVFGALLFAPLAAHVLDIILGGDSQQLLSVLGVSFLNGIYCLRFWLDCLAVCWFGMWQALSMKQPALASAKTILLVLILPAPLCVLDLFASLLFFSWGSMRLQQDLRWIIAKNIQGPPMLAPVRPLPVRPGVPPVIAR